MKTLILSAAILALAATAWAEVAKTDSAKGPEAPVIRRLPPLDPSKIQVHTQSAEEPKELADVEHGVYIHIVNEKRKEWPECFWRDKEIIEWGAEPGIKWFQNAYVLPEKVVLYRIRLTAETFRYLITTPNADPGARRIALRDIYTVNGFAEGERLRLIELASCEADPSLRHAAILTAAEYRPLSDAVPILCRALCDPDIKVSHAACDPVIDYFFPKKVDGKFLRVKSYNGCGVDLVMHDEVAAVAQKVHEVRPELVTDADLATIHALRDSRAPEEDRKAKTP
jgi:hypothetical protein